MAKFTTEEKIQIVLRYLKRNESIKNLAKEVGVSTPILSGWIRLYEQSGVEVRYYLNSLVEFHNNFPYMY
ncbi:transposase [Bacillus xiapuensis]|uniref:Transposase n=1 Tax=Bacillus xiapuensis TaxID=2014075 RepID=A0ABU6N5A2_9BACI|nr:transposase [Bacillus xiapuensis]